jgi:hypothetical protein
MTRPMPYAWQQAAQALAAATTAGAAIGALTAWLHHPRQP